MNYTLEILAAAESDFQGAIGWYEAIYPKLAADFKLTVTRTMEQLLHNPHIHGAVGNRIRRAPVHRFPYVIFFAVIGETVVVIAVFHTSRSPAIWQQRLSGH
jgi:plasmid stabilization system protein ParE